MGEGRRGLVWLVWEISFPGEKEVYLFFFLSKYGTYILWENSGMVATSASDTHQENLPLLFPVGCFCSSPPPA